MPRVDLAAGKSDFFIARAGADKKFAVQIGNILEDAGYSVILQDWDFADKNFVERMHDALIRASRVIVLLSPEYLASPYCTAEWVNAIAGDPLNCSGRLVLFRVQECAPEGMLRGLAYYDLLKVRDNPVTLSEIVLAAVKPGRHKMVMDASQPYWRPARTVLHNRIHAMPNFMGRRDHLTALDRALWERKTAVITQVAVQGLGGVGKSTLAVQYAWENRERYAGVWWLGAESSAGIVDGLVALGAVFIPDLVKVDDPVRAAETTLSFIADGGFERPWLLLYDNVEQPDMLDGLTPRAGAQVLITSRLPDWTGRATPIPLDVFSEDEAVQFLLNRSRRTDAEGAKRLAHDLGYLPLALDHAAAFCVETGDRFDEYAKRLAQWIAYAPKTRIIRAPWLPLSTSLSSKRQQNAPRPKS